MIFRLHYVWVTVTVAVFCTLLHAQDSGELARQLVAAKGGYVEKKRQFEELRIRAYVPILLKAVGKGPAWKPGHPNWTETERRIAEDWRKLYEDYLARMGRDAAYGWADQALAREYARAFTADELAALLKFYRSPAGGAAIALEREFLGFYPGELLRSLSRVMFGAEALSEREQQWLRAPESRERRDFIAVFESENILHAESLRIGSSYVRANAPMVQQGAIATSANQIDALRRKVEAVALAELQAFVKSELGRREREFVGATLPAATPAPEDPALAAKEEAAFYKGLAQLSARWRELASKNTQ